MIKVPTVALRPTRRPNEGANSCWITSGGREMMVQTDNPTTMLPTYRATTLLLYCQHHGEACGLPNKRNHAYPVVIHRHYLLRASIGDIGGARSAAGSSAGAGPAPPG